MTTKPMKPIKKIDYPLLIVNLETKEVKNRQPQLITDANQLLPLLERLLSPIDDKVEFEEYKKEVSRRLVDLEGYKNRIESQRINGTKTFSVADEVETTLTSPDPFLNPDGTRKTNPMGQWIAKPFSVEDQRRSNRILKVIDTMRETGGNSIELKPDDVIYLCNKMIRKCSEYTELGEHIVEMHDYFVDKKTDAEHEKRKSELTFRRK